MDASSIQASCPTCRSEFQAGVSNSNRVIRCQNCGESFRIRPVPVARRVIRAKEGGFPVGKSLGIAACVFVIAGMCLLNAFPGKWAKDSSVSKTDKTPTEPTLSEAIDPVKKPDSPTMMPGTILVAFTKDEDKTIVSIDYASHDLLTKYAGANDNIGIRNLHLQGRIFLVDNNTRIRVIRPHFFTVEVRIIDGAHAGKEGVIVREFIKAVGE